MPRRRPRPWWYGITPGGLIVTGTVALVVLSFAIGSLVAFAKGDKDTGEKLAERTVASFATLVALQARNRPDPAATVEQPANVTATSMGPSD